MALGYLFIQCTVKAVLSFLVLAKHPFHTLSFDASIIPHFLPIFYISLDFFSGFGPSLVGNTKPGSKKETRKEGLKEILGDKFYELPVTEIENLLSQKNNRTNIDKTKPKAC